MGHLYHGELLNNQRVFFMGQWVKILQEVRRNMSAGEFAALDDDFVVAMGWAIFRPKKLWIKMEYIDCCRPWTTMDYMFIQNKK